MLRRLRSLFHRNGTIEQKYRASYDRVKRAKVQSAHQRDDAYRTGLIIAEMRKTEEALRGRYG